MNNTTTTTGAGIPAARTHRIVETINNPIRDNRCRYGVKGLEKIEAGWLVFEQMEEVPWQRGLHFSHYQLTTGRRTYSIDADLFKKLKTEIHEITPAEQFNREFEGVGMVGFVRDLIETGKISIDDVREFFNRD